MTSTKQDFYCLSENAHNNLIILVRLEIMSEYGRGTVGIVCAALQIITTISAAMAHHTYSTLLLSLLLVCDTLNFVTVS